MYKLYKYLDMWFEWSVDFQSEYSVRNTQDLVDKFETRHPLPNSCSISVPDVGMFTESAPVNSMFFFMFVNFCDSYNH